MKDDAQACDRILQGDIELYHLFPVINALYEHGTLDVPALESFLVSPGGVDKGEIKPMLDELVKRELVTSTRGKYRLKASYLEWIKGLL
ncbi:MAG: hypothetical protein ACFFCS_15440 [Candidatus Hodarchaeota archaeon]